MTKRKKARASSIPPSTPPIRAGLQSPRRSVPAHIGRPPYAVDGNPGRNRMSPVRTPEEIVAMRRAGRAAADVLLHVGEFVAPGVTTDRLDQIVHDKTIELGGYPSPLNYRGYPKSVCTSVNEVICHGIPDSRPLADGDIVNIDVTVYLDGVHGDTSITFLVGDVDEASAMLVRETYRSLLKGIEVVKPGVGINQIGKAIETHARKFNLGVVREFIGHGVGPEFHGLIQVPHYYEPRARSIMVEGMTFTIEPMLTLGGPDLAVWDDDWTAVTLDGRRTAQFEHSLLVTADGVENLTIGSDGRIPAEVFAERAMGRPEAGVGGASTPGLQLP
jgi:methionyl aminopeptidase